MFPQVQLITMEETPEREAHAIKQLNQLGLTFKTHRFKKMSPGWKGCIDSHLKVYKYASIQSMDTVFVCEDNILAHDQVLPYDKYGNLFKFMDKCPDWGIIWIGGYILRPWDYCQKTEYPQVYETRNNNHGTVSYIIHSRLYKKIMAMNDLSPINVHYDIFISQFKCYIYNPLLFYHAHNIKSSINQKSDVWRKYWFHPSMMSIHSAIFFNQKLICMIVSAIIIYLIYSRTRKRQV